MPATNVPCPRPSPIAFGSRFVIVTCLTTRPPKSVRPAATPLSTIAIAGTFSGASVFPTKKSPTPAESTHVWSFVNWPERRIRESGVIARIPGRLARSTICAPVSSAETPFTLLKLFIRPFALPGFDFSELPTWPATVALFVPRLPCTMTSKTLAGWASASAIRLAGTSARAACTERPACPAVAATGAAKAATRARMAKPRPGLPQSALERDSPLGLPQSALPRRLPLVPVTCRIWSSPSSALVARAAFQFSPHDRRERAFHPPRSRDGRKVPSFE